MAESRAGYRNVVVGILIGLLVLAFAMWGVEDVFDPQASDVPLTAKCGLLLIEKGKALPMSRQRRGVFRSR